MSQDLAVTAMPGQDDSRESDSSGSQSHASSSSGSVSRPQVGKPRTVVAGHEGRNSFRGESRPCARPQTHSLPLDRRSGTRYNMGTNLNWKVLPQLEVKLINVPTRFNTLTLYRILEQFGNVVNIQMPDKRGAERIAYVKFQPPPSTAFWENSNILPAGVYASLSVRNTALTVQDPSNKGAQLPEQIMHHASSIEFGFMFDETKMMQMRSSGDQDVILTLDLRKKSINLAFHIYMSSKGADQDLGFYRLPLKLDKISHVFFDDAVDGSVLVISMELPPELHRRTVDIASTHKQGSRFWSEWDALVRQTDVVFDEQEFRKQPGGLRKDTAVVDIGRWTTYRIVFKKSDGHEATLNRMKRILSTFNVHVRQQHIDVLPRIKPVAWDLLDGETMKLHPPLRYAFQLQMLAQESYRLQFDTRYQLEVCISHGYLHESNFDSKFLAKLQDLDQKDHVQTVGILEKVATLRRRFFDAMEIFKLHVTFDEVTATSKPPRHCLIGRSATVTPTMVYFNSPTVEVSNRVIRQYANHSDRFLRVRFSDELGWGQIMSKDGQRNEELYERIRQLLRYGIVLGDTKYEFLAFGNSQFRDRGAYFFAPTTTLSCALIREQLGEITEDDARLPAKVCARLGQNFSTTRRLGMQVNIVTHKPGPDPDSKEIMLPDVKRNGYTFTDGVGKISTFLAKMIAVELELPLDDAPSVFQFRLGGCKGVLTIDPSLPSHDVVIRPSQYKFAAQQHGLEIIRTSSFASAHLNRQLISVLSALGVPDDVFVDKMKVQLEALTLALSLETVAVIELEKVVDTNQVTLKLAGMIQDGFMASREPFMMSMLRLWRSWTLKYLKAKAKIPVEFGAFLLGTVEEGTTLRGHFNHNKINPNDTEEQKQAKLPEIFCYIDWKRPGVYEAVKGVCIIARNPSLHPGDIRVVYAVDKPHLRHIKNSVVFPQTGDRDLSNMCSGGDLDGDDYIIIWDKSLIPKEWNHAPMDFTGAKPRPLGRKADVNDMIDFFVDYMKSDKLPFIATNHLALADFADLGVKDDRCRQLAELHSFAVDYPKSGVAVTIPDDLRRVKWPHFMEKQNTYHSKKVLGQLFDLVDKEDFVPDYTGTFDQKILDAFEHDVATLREAEALKCQYDSNIRKIMTRHDVATEFEVWSAFVMHHNKEKKDYNFAEELGTLMEAIRLSFREKCERKAGGRTPDKLHPFVAAMYTVTARQIQGRLGAQKEASPKSLSLDEMPLMSFPWLFTQELGKIARGTYHSERSVQRLQGTQKLHQVLGGLGDNDIVGGIKTSDGVDMHSVELFDPFGRHDTPVSGMNSDPFNLDVGPELNDGHTMMIEKDTGGHQPERAYARRDVQIESYRRHHDSPQAKHRAAPVQWNTKDNPIQAPNRVSDLITLQMTSHDEGASAFNDAVPSHDLGGSHFRYITSDFAEIEVARVQDGCMEGPVEVKLELSDSEAD